MNLQDLCVWSFEAQIQEFMLYSGDNPTRPASQRTYIPLEKSPFISLQKYFIQPTDKPKHSINIYRCRKHRFAYLFKFGGVVNLCLYLKYKVVAAVDAVFSPFYCACLINIQGALWSVLEHKTHGLACVECIPSLIKHFEVWNHPCLLACSLIRLS